MSQSETPPPSAALQAANERLLALREERVERVAGCRLPVAGEERVAGCQLPVAGEETPATGDSPPATGHRPLAPGHTLAELVAALPPHLGGESDRLVAGCWSLAAGEEAVAGRWSLAAGEEASVTGDGPPTTRDGQQATGNRQQATGHRQQATGHRPPATSYQLPTTIPAPNACIVSTKPGKLSLTQVA